MHGTGYRLENELYSMHWAGVPESKLDSMLYSSNIMDVRLHSFMNGELFHFASIHCISPQLHRLLWSDDLCPGAWVLSWLNRGLGISTRQTHAAELRRK